MGATGGPATILLGAQSTANPKRGWTIQSASPGAGPWTLEFGGSTFSGTYDSAMYLGYNARSGGALVQAGENSLAFVIEADYLTGGQHYMEAYWEYRSADALTSFRPYFVQINRATNLASLVLQAGAGGSISFMTDSSTQLLKLDANAFTVYSNIPIFYNFAGIKTFLQAFNNAGNFAYQVLGMDASNQLTIGGLPGGTPMARTIVQTPLQWQGAAIAGWQDAGVVYGGANADPGGLIFDLRCAAAANWGGRIYAGRWVTGNRGMRLVGVNSSANEKSYLHLDGQSDSFALGITITSNGADGTDRIKGNTTGLGFFNVTPVARPSAYTQTYATADKTHAADGSADLATTAATQTTPWGFASQAQADAIATQHNLLRAQVLDLKQLVNSVIDDFQALGLLQ